MKKYIILPLTILLFSFTMKTSSRQPFPLMKGHTLEKKEMTLPADLKGKYALLAIASSMRAQQDLETWLQPMYSSFAENPMYAVNMFVVPMTNGFILAGSDKIEQKIKSSMDKEFYKYVLVYDGEVNPLRKELGMDEKDKPYIFVVDPRGVITYRTSGVYTEAKMEQIADALSE